MKKKILIVDDSPTPRNNLEVMFEDKQLTHLVELFSASNGFDGLVKVLEIQPDLIIMDWHMDGLDGLDTVYLLKSQPDFSNIPIIMLSGDGTVVDKTKGLLIGADDFISKGLSFDEYLNILNKYLQIL